MSNGFFSLPRALYSLPAWIGAKLKYRAFFHEILSRAVWKEQEYNANGHIITLKPGQYCSSIRRMVEDFNPKGLRGKAAEDVFSKNDIEGGIQYFLYHRLLRQEIRHDITIITICISGLCEEFDKLNQTDNQTEIRQKSDTKEIKKESNKEEKEKKYKKEKIQNEEKIIPLENQQAVNQDFSLEPPECKENIFKHNVYSQTLTLSQSNENESNQKKSKKQSLKPIEELIPFREWVQLTQKQHDTLIQKHGLDLTNSMLNVLDAYNTQRQQHYKCDYGAMKEGGWVYEKATRLLAESKQKSNAPNQSNVDYAMKCESKFKNEVQKKGYSMRLGHNYIEITPSGGNGQPFHLKFTDHGFKDQLNSFLRRFGCLVGT